MPRNQPRDSKGRFAYAGTLTKQQLDCIYCMVYEKDVSPTHIAKKIGVSRQSIYTWLASNDEFNKELKKQKRAYIQGMANEAMKVVHELMNQKQDKRVALKAALETLKTCGDYQQDLNVNTEQSITITLADSEDEE